MTVTVGVAKTRTWPTGSELLLNLVLAHAHSDLSKVLNTDIEEQDDGEIKIA
jgi:hypothetical protein